MITSVRIKNFNGIRERVEIEHIPAFGQCR
jgi:AAA15 family ATPase/GTPase